MFERGRMAVPALVAGCFLAGLLVTLLFLVTPTSRAMPRQAGRAVTNPIVTENALPGTDEWASIGNYDINNLSAYPGATSVNAGGPIGIYAKSSGTTLSARLYRLGYYQNHGARLVTTYSGIATPAQPA